MMMNSVPVPRPPKRARVTADKQDAVSRVKSERSPSPTIIERKLVTEGTKRFTPLPVDCLSSCLEYKKNRSEWMARCVKELESLNLVTERKLIRDDGLIIDWRSQIPVWSDTLKPDTLDLAATIVLAHRSNAQWRSPTRSESLSRSPATQQCRTSSSSQPPVPVPRPPLKCRNRSSRPVSTNSCRPLSLSPVPERQQFGEETNPRCDRISNLSGRISAPPDISCQHGQVAPASGRVCDPLVPYAMSAVSEEEMSQMTLDYLHRYVQTYEGDRAGLASAYGRNASFAYRVHQIVQNNSAGGWSIPVGFPRCFCSGPERTRLDIVTTLMALPCLHSCAQNRDAAQVEYDMFYLGGERGMFVVCRVVLPAETVVHNFILQRKDVNAEDAATKGVWPLTATAHQILVFRIRTQVV